MAHSILHHSFAGNTKDEGLPAEINMAKIPVSGDIAGLVFAAGTVLIFFWGIPEIRYLLPAAIVAGCGIAVGLHFIRHEDKSLHIFTDVEGQALEMNTDKTKMTCRHRIAFVVCTFQLPAQVFAGACAGVRGGFDQTKPGLRRAGSRQRRPGVSRQDDTRMR